MSIPNLLAVVRLILTPIAMALILASPNSDRVKIAAVVVFVAAALTDYADGFLARRWQITTTFGAFLDLLADKVLVAGALI
ncbi:MAG: CDP-alcohol phosphatidyltransferase family protein, partial [Acidobacteria bacterium]|nr:CDP-alcohol phosphatidyltransferase family protein [Acidobacteriota bacterium]